MIEKESVIEKECSKCMYYKNEIYCIRKKQETENGGYCLHYVSVDDMHSIVKVVDSMQEFFGWKH
ncbi:MAG: hypothetical protein NC318_10955 [Blautia sp.]|nr:hypothetical protein [Blautia sp.]